MKSLFFLCIVTLVLSSCRSIYTPTTPNVPLFTDKNQLDAEATAFTNGFNGKVAYSIFDHVAVQLNGQHSRQMLLNNPKPHHHDYVEGAAGLFHCFKNQFVIEMYGGYGRGRSDYGSQFLNGQDYITEGRGHYEKTFVQLNLGSHKLIDDGMIGISCRLGNVRYTYDYCSFRWLNNTTIDHLSIEPYFFLTQQVNKRVSLVANAGLTFIEGNTNDMVHASIRTNFMNLGIGIRISLGRDWK